MMLERYSAVAGSDDIDAAGLPCSSAVQQGGMGVTWHHFTVVLLDSSASLLLGWVLDVLAEANRVGEACRFTWDAVSLATYMEAERIVAPQGAGSGCASCTAIFVAGDRLQLHLGDLARERLRKSVRQSTLALACGPAVELFAACSLLKDKSAAACRTTRPWLREKYPETSFRDVPLYWNGTIGTAAGGVAIAMAVVESLVRLGQSALAEELKGRLLLPSLKVERPGLSPRARFGARSSKIARAISFMQQNLENEVQIEGVASDVGSSVRQLERLFKTQLQTTPARFLKRLRLEQAKELLLNTDLSIVEIVCATGFESPTHFSKCFKRVFSVAPTRWREGKRHGSAAAASRRSTGTPRAARPLARHNQPVSNGDRPGAGAGLVPCP